MTLVLMGCIGVRIEWELTFNTTGDPYNKMAIPYKRKIHKKLIWSIGITTKKAT